MIALFLVVYILGWFLCAGILAIVDENDNTDFVVYFVASLFWPIISCFVISVFLEEIMDGIKK